MHDFEQLEVWRLAHRLALDAYAITQRLPPEERFGLTSQIRRCAVSIPANIAEGAGIGGGSFVRHLKIAAGSCSELQAEIYIAHDLDLLPFDAAGDLAENARRVRQMTARLIAAYSQ